VCPARFRLNAVGSWLFAFEKPLNRQDAKRAKNIKLSFAIFASLAERAVKDLTVNDTAENTN